MKINKEQAIIHASKILPVFYSETNPESISAAIAACANEDEWEVAKMLEQLIQFETKIVKTLTKDIKL